MPLPRQGRTQPHSAPSDFHVRHRQEPERRRLEAEREERERCEWEAAVSGASGEAVHAVRAERFGTALEQWQASGEIRTFAPLSMTPPPRRTTPSKPSDCESGGLREGGGGPARPHAEWQRSGCSRLPRGADGRSTAAVPRRLAPAPAGEGDEARYTVGTVQGGARSMARSHRRTSGSRLEIWTPRSRSMVEAMTPWPRSRRTLAAFSTSSPSLMTSARGATNSS